MKKTETYRLLVTAKIEMIYFDGLNLCESKTEETGDQKMKETNKVKKKWYAPVGSSNGEKTSDSSSVTSSEEQLYFSPIS